MTRTEIRVLALALGARPDAIEAALATMPTEAPAPLEGPGYISMTLPDGGKIEGEFDANGNPPLGDGGRAGRGA